MQPTIVAAFDPECADQAPVALGRVLAASLRARLLIVAVRPGGSEADRLARVETAWPPGALATLTELPEHLAGADLETVEAPSAAGGLHDVLEAEHPLVAVLGSALAAPYGRLLVGSTAERLLGGAPCAIALAPRGYTERALRTIVAGALPGPEERAAVEAASTLASGAGADLQVVTVVRRVPAALPDCAERALYVGDPADTLVWTSQRADLLVLGSRAYGPVQRVLAGGVARRVLAGARCPVMVVPRAAAPQPLAA